MRYFAALSMLLLTATPAVVSCENSDQAVRAAIVDAVRARVGGDAEVIVDRLQIFTNTASGRDACRASAACQVTPDPAARLGRAIRFTLSAIKRDGAVVRFERVGAAEATVTVTAPVTRATAVIRRGELVSDANVESVQQPLAGLPLRRMPAVAELVGARALRDIAPGERLSAGMVLVPPAVKTGQHVTAISRIGDVEVSATLMAAESGVSGDIIRLVNPDSRRAMRARILSSSRVEIVHD
jgi:flagella basal body P-ring formation protein FlgA